MQERYRPLSIAAHWIMAVVVFGQLALGWWMIGLPKTPPGLRAGWFNLHKSVGIALFALLVLRAWQRRRQPPPPLPPSIPAWQRAFAQSAHLALYALLAMLPVTGFVGSLASGYPIKFFGLPLPLPTLELPLLKQLTSTAHYSLVWMLMALLAAHIAAALQHLLRGDGVFARMLPGAR